MAHFGKDLDTFSASRTIRIISSEAAENYTVYVIEVTVGSYSWTVRHRYSDFHDLHEKLVSTCKLDKNLLPPKKLFGNQSESFIRKRQVELEIYLQTVLYYLAHKVPPTLSNFLHFNRYEIHGITQALAEDLYNRGEGTLQAQDVFPMTPLQLYALTERLKLPEPTCESGDVKKDIGHILDFITRLKYLRICGASVGEIVGTSNIYMYQLTFDLTLFKSIQYLEILNCKPRNIVGLETVKQTLCSFQLCKSAKAIREFLLPDIPHWKGDDGTLLVSYWEHVRDADFGNNFLTEIDDSVQLMPKLERLTLCGNQLSHIQHLQWLSQLTYLDISNNNIQILDSLHTKLGNLKTLKVANNKLETLQGFSKLFCLQSLDVSNNEISLISEVKPVGGLPCLESLLLIGNPVTIVLDYRTKVLETFGDRVNEVVLDRQKSDQKELDTVAVLQALQKAKDSKDRGKRLTPKKTASSASLADSDYSCTPPSRVPGNGQTPPSSVIHRSGISQVTSGSPALTPVSSYYGRSSSPRTFLSGPESNQIDGITLGSHMKSALPVVHPDTDLANTADLKASASIDTSAKKIFVIGSDEPDDKNVDQPSDKTPKVTVLNFADLPSAASPKFMSWIQKHLIGGGSPSRETTAERIIDILWCHALQYSSNQMFPCCAVLTKNKIFIERLTDSDSGLPGVPDMEPFYIIPMCNVQQLVQGCCHAYMKLEESFVGKMGTFILIGLDPSAVRTFTESFKKLCQIPTNPNAPDMLDLSCDSDISRQIFNMEDKLGSSSDRVVFSCVVVAKPSQTRCLLVLSENQVFLLDFDCIYWPQPSFESEPEEMLQLGVMQHHSIMDRISDINMYGELNKVKKQKKNALRETNIRFSEFGLSMTYHESSGAKTFNVLFPSTSSRDFYLDRLTNLRAEYAHRMSPTLREEPEGGNEHVDPPDRGTTGHSDTASSLPSSFDLTKYYVSKTRPDVKKPAVTIDSTAPPTVDSTAPPTVVVEEADSDILFSSVRKQKHKEAIYSSGDVDTKEEDSLLLAYLSIELEEHLKISVRDYKLVHPLPTKLKPFLLMDGRDLATFFHSIIAVKMTPDRGVLMEELHHVLWTKVVPYSNPKLEIPTLVMVSTRGVYFVSDSTQNKSGSRPPWMTHARHTSDSAFAWKTDDGKTDVRSVPKVKKRGSIKPYCVLKYSDIQQINVGLFDQCIRLTGQDAHTVFTLAVRDSLTTSSFLQKLTGVLSLIVASPMVDKDTQDLELDFYKAFAKRTKSTIEGLEYTHPSQVRFCYPGEDAIEDILYLVRESIPGLPSNSKQILWMYLLGYVVPEGYLIGALEGIEPRSIILTSTHICLAEEDIVTYPLPDFVRGLPENPQHKIIESRKVEDLKRIVMYSSSPNVLQLIFMDQKDEVVVDTSLDHFSEVSGIKGREPCPEFCFRLYIQSSGEKEKFILQIKKHWKELNPEVGRILDIVTE